MVVDKAIKLEAVDCDDDVLLFKVDGDELFIDVVVVDPIISIYIYI